MKCNNCGFEHTENFKSCQNCGASAPIAEPVSLNPAHNTVLAAIKNPLFLILCILSTTFCIFSIAANDMPLINILITVFLWLTYAQSFRGIADEDNIRSISGCVYANYVIVNVVSIICIVCSGIIALASVLIDDSKEFFETIISDFMKGNPGIFKPFEFVLNETIHKLSFDSANILSVLFIIFGIIFFVMGIAVLLLNILGYRKIHKFIKSIHEGITYQNSEFYKPVAARNWLIFFTVCSIINHVGNITLLVYNNKNIIPSIIASICNVICQIIGIIIINRHFVPQKA